VPTPADAADALAIAITHWAHTRLGALAAAKFWVLSSEFWDPQRWHQYQYGDRPSEPSASGLLRRRFGPHHPRGFARHAAQPPAPSGYVPPATPRGRRTDRHVARGAGCLSPAAEL